MRAARTLASRWTPGLPWACCDPMQPAEAGVRTLVVGKTGGERARWAGVSVAGAGLWRRLAVGLCGLGLCSLGLYLAGSQADAAEPILLVPADGQAAAVARGLRSELARAAGVETLLFEDVLKGLGCRVEPAPADTAAGLIAALEGATRARIRTEIRGASTDVSEALLRVERFRLRIRPSPMAAGGKVAECK